MMRTVFNSWGDRNTGAGYGTTKAKFSGKDYPAPSTYPYDEPVEALLDYTDEDEETFGDIAQKIDMSNIAKQATTGRTDRGSFTKMRLDLAEAVNDSNIMTGMVPFPFSSLYKKFSGPAAGGVSSASVYKTGPGHNKFGTVRGWSQAPNTNVVGDMLTITNLHDMIDPGIRSIAKSNLMIKIAQQESD